MYSVVPYLAVSREAIRLRDFGTPAVDAVHELEKNSNFPSMFMVGENVNCPEVLYEGPLSNPNGKLQRGKEKATHSHS